MGGDFVCVGDPIPVVFLLATVENGPELKSLFSVLSSPGDDISVGTAYLVRFEDCADSRCEIPIEIPSFVAQAVEMASKLVGTEIYFV